MRTPSGVDFRHGPDNGVDVDRPDPDVAAEDGLRPGVLAAFEGLSGGVHEQVQGAAGVRETLVAPVEHRPGSWRGAPATSRRRGLGGLIRGLIRLPVCDHPDRQGRGEALGRADGEKLGDLRDRIGGDGVRALLALFFDLVGAADRVAASPEHLGQGGGKQVTDG